MTPSKKSALLRTFSEFTIDELRAMPFSQVFSLFFREVKQTLTGKQGESKTKKGTLRKKKAEKHILTAGVTSPKPKAPSVFVKAMQQIVARTPSQKRKNSAKSVAKLSEISKLAKEKKPEAHEEKIQNETVVFSSETDHFLHTKSN